MTDKFLEPYYILIVKRYPVGNTRNKVWKLEYESAEYENVYDEFLEHKASTEYARIVTTVADRAQIEGVVEDLNFKELIGRLRAAEEAVRLEANV